jgi:hypothetical protein
MLQALADTLVLGSLLEQLRSRFGHYELLDHWTQGEFHHDIVVRVPRRDASLVAPPNAVPELPGAFLVVATNCNGGVKEVLSFGSRPDRSAVWHWRCPEVSEFSGEIPPILGRAVTQHWFDPCDLLVADARSELREEFRERQSGGGWKMTGSAEKNRAT